MTFKAVMSGLVCVALVAGCTATRAPPPLLAKVEPLVIDPSLARPRQVGPIAITPLAEAEMIPAPMVLAPVAVNPVPPALTSEQSIDIRPLSGAPPVPVGSVGPAGTMATGGAVSAASTVGAVAARAIQPPIKASAKASASAVIPDVPPNGHKATPLAAKPEAMLDVAALKERLRNTGAIGLFTKLALKNQVDDLLAQFRSYHDGARKNGIGALREPYNILVGKVLALIEDGDPPLAHTLSASREAIWIILVDPEKFKSAT